MKIILASIAVAALAGCSTTHAPSPSTAPLTAEEARASETKDFAAAMVAAKDGNVQNLLILAWALRGKGDIPQQVQQAPSVAGIVLGVVDRLIGVTPAWFAYKSSIRNSQTTETVAAINRDVSVAQSNNFTQLGIAGIQGAASVGAYAASALSNVALRPSTSITVTGNTGPSNVGTGQQTNSSFNPVNPAPKVCAPNATGVIVCQ
jgi:hypothetical protein